MKIIKSLKNNNENGKLFRILNKKTGVFMIDVANRLLQLRKAAGLSQRELARKTGVSNGTISQIEQGNSDPSISLLRKILEGLNLTAADFFQEEVVNEQHVFFHRDDFVDIGSGKVKYLQMGSSIAGRAMQVLREIYPPGSSTGHSELIHEAEEAGIIISGQLEVTVGNQRRTLSAGDGYYFNSRQPHGFRNTGSVDCVLISTCTPPF